MADTHMLLFHKYLSIFVVFMLIIESYAYSDKNKPCKYLDSINITNGIPNDDGSITFEGINYPKNLYAWYDYEFLNESYSQPVVSHMRGCTCKLGKPCIRMCCPRGQIRLQNQCDPDESAFDVHVMVTKRDESFTTGNIFDMFHHVVGKPCYDIIPMEPERFPDSDTWELLENGSVRSGSELIEILNRNRYCFNPVYRNESIELELELMTCFKEVSDKDYWIPYGMFLSVPFLLVTILVYILLPELRNVHGKSLVCYLLGLTIGYLTLGWIKLNGSKYVEALLCRTLGYVVYCAFMSAFFWLNVISFDLWWYLRKHSTNRFSEMKTFLIYSAYAWGSTILMAVLCHIIDASSIPYKLQPGMGVETCFLKKERLSEFLYFYLPIIIIMTCNSTFFILTALNIRKIQTEAPSVLREDSTTDEIRRIHHEKAKFVVFFRLFIVMGISWTMEAISWLIAPGAWYFFVTDLMNAIQGVVIFILFVMSRKTKKLIIKRWNTCRGKARKQETISMFETISN